MPFRVLELFSGLGGAAAAVAGLGRSEDVAVVAGLDLDRRALAVAGRNFAHPQVACTLESLPASRLAAYAADLWWMSPPCQPFTRRGLGRDVDDSRCRPFLALLERLAEVRPPYLALENVPEFQGSRAHVRLRETLERCGYRTVLERLLCPSELGVPNRRRRFYLVAAGGELGEGRTWRDERPLAAYLDGEDPTGDDPGLDVEPALLERYAGALDLVERDDPAAVTACFTSAYGRSPVRSGSYLATERGARRFSPREILRLLGFPERYTLPPDVPRRAAWKLAGNSLSLNPVRLMLTHIPELGVIT